MSIQRLLRTSLLLAALPVAGLLAGCQTTDTTAAQDGDDVETQAALTDGDKAGASRRPHRGMHGPGEFFAVALESLDLSATDRATIENLARALQPARPDKGERGPSAEDRKALAAAIRSGSVDASKLEIGAPPAPLADAHDKLVAGLQELHDMLSDEQRAQLVHALEERAFEKADDRSEGPPPGAGRHGPRDGERPDGPPDGQRPVGPPRGDHAHGPGGRGGPPIDHMLGDLDVTDAQREKILAALEAAGLGRPVGGVEHGPKGDRAEGRAALIEAFADAKFDAKSALPAPEAAASAGPPSPAKVLSVIVPLLDEAQRAKLADRVEQGPPARER